jgi:hypothetical protein
MPGRIVTLEEVESLIGQRHVFGLSPDGTITDYGPTEELPDDMLPFDGGRELRSLLERPIAGAYPLFPENFVIDFPVRHWCRNTLPWEDEIHPELPGQQIPPPAVRSLTRPKPLPLRKMVLLAATKGIV